MQGGGTGSRLFRNRPGTIGAVLMGILGTMGILHHVRSWLAIRSAIPEHSFFQEFPFTALFIIFLALGFSRFVQEVEVDPQNALVTSRFGLSGYRRTFTLSKDEWQLQDVHAVGIVYVHRGPAALNLAGAKQTRRLATFYVRESRARELGQKIAAAIGVPFFEIDGLGNRVRRLA